MPDQCLILVVLDAHDHRFRRALCFRHRPARSQRSCLDQCHGISDRRLGRATNHPWNEAPRYMIRDRDRIYGAVVTRRLRAMGIRDKPISPASPWQNGFAERLIGSIRRECVDHIIVLGEMHLRRVLKSYADYYNSVRTHRSLNKDAPVTRQIQRIGTIKSHAILGGTSPPLRPSLSFRYTQPAWRQANAGHVSLGQLKVMSAIESCRTVALGGHVMRCEDCLHTQIAYNSCRNRHCPKCQGSQALAWMKQRKSELLDVPYFHVVFTLPARIAAIAYQNKAVVYDLLFKASSQTMRTIAADPNRLGVKIGFTSVLHTWGSAMTHHPHVHMVVPGGGISLDGTRWISCRPNFLLPVKVLSRLFRRLMLQMLLAAHHVGRLQF